MVLKHHFTRGVMQKSVACLTVSEIFLLIYKYFSYELYILPAMYGLRLKQYVSANKSSDIHELSYSSCAATLSPRHTETLCTDR